MRYCDIGSIDHANFVVVANNVYQWEQCSGAFETGLMSLIFEYSVFICLEYFGAIFLMCCCFENNERSNSRIMSDALLGLIPFQ